jgi:hypothetical protein
LKLLSHIKTSDVFNVKHLVAFTGDTFDEDVNSRANSLQPREDDIDQDAIEFMKKTGANTGVQSRPKTHRNELVRKAFGRGPKSLVRNMFGQAESREPR